MNTGPEESHHSDIEGGIPEMIRINWKNQENY
jgi:hypothetical protein